ncbi:Crp/Fnr family transcriptional regulator [Qipengyuania sediminis]|uniref:Crp/Fnr family transcriptional regulator n=1 Tax=Qipengyuania sediminis TaxID=1532023 RepID=UPI00105A2290|nr:Crp/Fnr family transcriptional regulator [Qipengyuania sediminis]
MGGAFFSDIAVTPKPAFSGLSGLDYVKTLVSDEQEYQNGTRLVARGDRLHKASVLLDGFVLRTMFADGRRFVVGVHVPGEFMDLHGFALKRLDHDLVASGPVRVASITHDRLDEIVRERPGTARSLWLETLLDAAIHRKWIQNLERLDAPRRIAHLYCEMRERLELIGRTVGRTLRTPFTQQDLADMCGVSAIHANRAVAKLRELALGEIRRGDLYVGDWASLQSYARFDPGYLFGHKQAAC